MSTELMTFDPAKRRSHVVVPDGDPTKDTTAFTVMIMFEQPDKTYEVPIGAILDAAEKGFQFTLPAPDEGIDLGHLGDFYDAAAKMLPLPPMEVKNLPSPLKEIAGTMVNVRVFEINTLTGKLRFDVKFTPQPPISLPLFTSVKIKYAEFMMDRPGTAPPPTY